MGNQGKFLGDSLAVMAGLVPAIHAVMPRNHFPPWESPEATAASVGDKRPAFDPPNRVDGRVEPGHDARPVYLGICPRCRYAMAPQPIGIAQKRRENGASRSVARASAPAAALIAWRLSS
jgi:hypothetical protein